MYYNIVFSKFDYQYKVINTETGLAQSSWTRYSDAQSTVKFMNAVARAAQNKKGKA